MYLVKEASALTMSILFYSEILLPFFGPISKIENKCEEVKHLKERSGSLGLWVGNFSMIA